jgi:hypothetical protein
VNDDHEYSQLAAELLAERSNEARPRSVDRMRGIAVVAQAISEQQHRRRRRRLLLACSGVAVAASVALAAGFWGAHHGSRREVSAVAAGTERGSVAGRPFEPGQSVVAAKGHSAVVNFGSITRIRLDELSELEYREGDATRRFALLRGAIHLRVAKLKPEQRFLVETPDAEIEVRGTEFDVAVPDSSSNCGGSRTRVSVREGAVEVRFQGQVARVPAGGHWPESCGASAARAEAKEPKAALSAPSRSAELPSHARTQRVPVESAALQPSASELAEQNDIFASAAAARHAGRIADALALYDRLLMRFPGGPLAESASIGKLRLLSRTDPEQARVEARRYLSRYPRGMARAEANALLKTP